MANGQLFGASGLWGAGVCGWNLDVQVGVSALTHARPFVIQSKAQGGKRGKNATGWGLPSSLAARIQSSTLRSQRILNSSPVLPLSSSTSFLTTFPDTIQAHLLTPWQVKVRIHGEKLYLPDSKKHLQESADARDEEHGADEVALGEGVVLQTQVLGQDERHCHESPQGREEVLWVEQRE